MSETQPTDPNSPWSPDEASEEFSPEQIMEIKKSLPLLHEVIVWYEEQIAIYSNPEIITGVNPSSKPEDVKQAVMFAQSMIAGYKDKRKEFAARFKKHLADVQG